MPELRSPTAKQDVRSASAFVLFILPFIAGSGAANVYYHQPVLGQLLAEFGPSAATLVATATLWGYGLASCCWFRLAIRGPGALL